MIKKKKERNIEFSVILKNELKKKKSVYFYIYPPPKKGLKIQ